jgi:4-hydroxybenzoate polyprenyltransferase
MGLVALGLQPLAYEARKIDAESLVLFAASTFWTMIYDSVYAFQDIKDDLKIGVGSMAVLFKYRIKPVLWTLVIGMATCLSLLGVWEDMGQQYFIVGVGGTALCLGLMVANVDLRDSSSCWWWFSKGFWYAAGSMIGGLFLEYLRVVDITKV